MRDAHDRPQTSLNIGDIRIRAQPDQNSTVNPLDVSEFGAFDRLSDISDEPVLKEGSVLALQPDLAVVNNEDVLHVCPSTHEASMSVNAYPPERPKENEIESEEGWKNTFHVILNPLKRVMCLRFFYKRSLFQS